MEKAARSTRVLHRRRHLSPVRIAARSSCSSACAGTHGPHPRLAVQDEPARLASQQSWIERHRSSSANNRSFSTATSPTRALGRIRERHPPRGHHDISRTQRDVQAQADHVSETRSSRASLEASGPKEGSLTRHNSIAHLLDAVRGPRATSKCQDRYQGSHSGHRLDLTDRGRAIKPTSMAAQLSQRSEYRASKGRLEGECQDGRRPTPFGTQPTDDEAAVRADLDIWDRAIRRINPSALRRLDPDRDPELGALPPTLRRYDSTRVDDDPNLQRIDFYGTAFPGMQGPLSLGDFANSHATKPKMPLEHPAAEHAGAGLGPPRNEAANVGTVYSWRTGTPGSMDAQQRQDQSSPGAASTGGHSRNSSRTSIDRGLPSPPPIGARTKTARSRSGPLQPAILADRLRLRLLQRSYPTEPAAEAEPVSEDVEDPEADPFADPNFVGSVKDLALVRRLAQMHASDEAAAGSGGTTEGAKTLLPQTGHWSRARSEIQWLRSAAEEHVARERWANAKEKAARIEEVLKEWVEDHVVRHKPLAYLIGKCLWFPRAWLRTLTRGLNSLRARPI